MTGIYVDPVCPGPKTGDPVSWDGGSAWVGGVRYRRLGYEFNPDAPLN
jgi:hypothetical protein